MFFSISISKQYGLDRLLFVARRVTTWIGLLLKDRVPENIVKTYHVNWLIFDRLSRSEIYTTIGLCLIFKVDIMWTRSLQRLSLAILLVLIGRQYIDESSIALYSCVPNKRQALHCTMPVSQHKNVGVMPYWNIRRSFPCMD